MEIHFLVVTILWLLSIDTCKSTQLICQDIKELVDGHNNRRQLLLKGQVPGQPMAEYMKHMVWDEELAAKAKKWANKYVFKYNPNRFVGSGRFTTGENIYWFSTLKREYEFNYEQPLEAWWNEHKNFTFQVLTNSTFGKSKNIGHYTQMAWADSNNLGCGTFETMDDGWVTFFLVCDYGPTGNYIGQSPYKSATVEGRMICESPDCVHPYGDNCYFD